MISDESFNDYISEHTKAVNLIDVKTLNYIAYLINYSISRNGTIFTCGNGGSASDALHFSAELVGRFEKDRKSIKAICLNSNVSDITAIANDYGYEHIFSRPLLTCDRNDIVIGFTTSGNSKNVIAGLEVAKKNRAITICFTGNNPDANVLKVSDFSIKIDSNRTSIIQECHIICVHLLAKMIEDEQLKLQ